MSLLVEARQVTFSYGRADILKGAGLSVSSGELCCLMGVNGCGKSTLLDCILGVNEPSGGIVLVGGRSVASCRPAELARLLSYVPQVHDRSFPYLVSDIVLMGRTVHQSGLKSPGEEDRSIVLEALSQCGIEHLSDRPYTQLSGGEMQMVMLARSLAQRTPLIVMDEPTAHLDFRNELLFCETVARLVKEGAVGVLMATHSPNQAFYFEDEGVAVTVALMGEGRIVARGNPKETLTAERIADLYGIKACVASHMLSDGREVRRIVPLETQRR